MKETHAQINLGAWRVWHAELISLVNGDFASLKMRLLAEFAPETAFRITANAFVQRCGHVLLPEHNRSDSHVKVCIPPCRKPTASVARLIAWLQQYLVNDLYAVVLHGSLGSSEVVPYSDFDVLVVVRDKVLNDAVRLAYVGQRLFEARRFMYEQDPLQHHGWFVLPEQAVNAWPEDYLPVEVLNHACQLTSSEMQELHINPVMDRNRSLAQFHKLADSIENELSTGSCFTNIYRFKAMLSKALLLPALYVQSRDGIGVFKKDSFISAMVDFSPDDWEVVNTASAIREDWPNIQCVFPCFFSQRPGLIGNLHRRYHSRPVPSSLRLQYGEQSSVGLMRLINAMRLRLKEPAEANGMIK